jgi:peptidoglycan/LPS O-acetylase OafA/YrhL
VHERRATGTLSLRGFWARRARRLLPSLVVVGLLVLVAFGLVGGAQLRHDTLVGVPTALGYLTVWANLFGWWGTGWMGHAWSLSVEEAFYVLFPIGAILVGRALGWRWVYIATAVAVAYYLAAGNLWGWSPGRVYGGPDTRAFQLLIGCALGVYLARPRGPVPRWVRASVVALSAAVLVAWAATIDPNAPVYADGGMLLVAVCAAVIVWHLMTAPASRTSRALSARPLVWTGRRSYTIYLIHYPLIGLIVIAGSRTLSFAVVATLTLLWAGVSYRFIERPWIARHRLVPAEAS